MRVQNEQERLAALYGYEILNTLPEDEYNYIVELAAAICDTPVSLINFIDSDKTWFKAKVGVPDNMEGTPRDISFCTHNIINPVDILEIKDLLKDPRFENNPLVTNDPNVRFYAGCPLVSNEGYVLGSLCVLDNKPRELSEAQIKVLKTLAQKVIENLEHKKELIQQQKERDYAEELLHKVADKAPGAIYKFQITSDGKMSFPFMSKGISKIHPGLTAEMLMQEIGFGVINVHPDDKERVEKSVIYSYENVSRWEEEYRIVAPDGTIFWHSSVGLPEKKDDGTVVWFGTYQDVTKKKQYTEKIEEQNKILFEIAWEQSHVVRAPLSRIMALVNTLSNSDMDKVNKELLEHIGKSAEHLDDIIRGIVSKSEELKIG